MCPCEVYLAQTPPRSLDNAYRRYQAEKRSERGQKEASEIRVGGAPGIWRRWFRGQDSRSQAIPGAKPWAERAEAYDDHLAALERQMWEQRRLEVREADWAAGDGLRELASQILAQGPQFIKTTRRLVKGTGGQPDREVITLALDSQALIRILKLASDLQRNAAEVASPAQRVEFTGKDGEPIQGVQVVVYLPDNGRDTLDDDDDDPVKAA